MNKLFKAAALGACRCSFPLTEKLLDSVLHNRAAETPLRKPIIVIGPERSGTTLVYALLSNHPELCALYNMADAFPDHPFSSSILQRLFADQNQIHTAIPDTAGEISGNIFSPREAIRYWARHLGSKRGNWRAVPDDCFSAEDLDARTRVTLPLDLRKRIYAMGKTRLLLKQPGFSLKIKYLDALFPDAIFVHCLRNPLTNFASLVAQKKLSGNPDWGLRVPDWQKWCDLPLEVRAARQLAVTHRVIAESIAEINDSEQRYVPVRYEELHDNFSTEVRNLFDRCELETPAIVLENSSLFVLSSGRRGVALEMIENSEARETLGDLCARMGYEPSVESRVSASNGHARVPRKAEPLRERVINGISGAVSNATQMAVSAPAAILPPSWLSNYRAAVKWFFARKTRRSLNRPTFREQWAENWVTILASWLLLAGVTTLHHFANPHMVFSPFYLVPCGMLALTLNYRWGMAIAGVAAVAGPVVQSFGGEEFSAWNVILWNFVMRFILYGTFVFLLDRVRVEAVSTQTSRA